ncbi:MAG: Nif3-like dinuclear metal center hexameric protein [Anaerococcus sp.]|uniref:Nif3-like dinuclear metal center hexameric protein n=1 Tax=Anaerococcus sp. TaxID=1872515 RepID=UPI002635D13A|nr:Nif3-like dinuclear metal center hexameric protein [Anaerococcus sp.]MCI5972265.1 Nif3-like dinuclear metal center hexameric protein [Anaerococcus sp.]MDD6918943.1 Nif3-like dinuclear metal center hexameric protein [Peptoniphilaceae bacterium]MDY2927206.1 Nif3-like dinuclear metal center hexameric protein [Anaerococcus sp.]
MEIKELIEKLEKKYPFSLQEEWDNSGLQIGNPNDEVKNILVSLDLEEEGMEEAIANDCNLIITHHPYLFSGAKSIDFSEKFYQRLKACIKNDITVYAFHTNLDIAKGGVNDNLCRILGIDKTRVLEQGKDLGLGRYGFIEEKDSDEFIREIKDKLKASGIVVYGDLSKKVKKIGVCGGAGSDLIRDALDISCDMIITGDVKYHDGMDLANEGIIICDVGHFASENHIIYKLQKDIEEIFDGEVITFSKDDSFRKFY